MKAVAKRSVVCHALGIGAQQRQDREGWTEIVDRTVAWGGGMGTEERQHVMEYLTAYLGR